MDFKQLFVTLGFVTLLWTVVLVITNPFFENKERLKWTYFSAIISSISFVIGSALK